MIVFISLLCVLLLLLLLPVSARIKWEQELEIWVGYAFFHIRVNQPKSEAQKSEEQAEKRVKKNAKKQAKADQPKKPPQPAELTEKIDLVLDLIASATGGLGMLWRNLCVQSLTLHMTVAEEDACATALACGKMNAYLYSAYATLQSYLKIKHSSIQIQPDFLSDKGSFALDARVRITPLVALGAVLRMGASFLWKLLRKRAAQPPAKPSVKG